VAEENVIIINDDTVAEENVIIIDDDMVAEENVIIIDDDTDDDYDYWMDPVVAERMEIEREERDGR